MYFFFKFIFNCVSNHQIYGNSGARKASGAYKLTLTPLITRHEKNIIGHGRGGNESIFSLLWRRYRAVAVRWDVQEVHFMYR